MDASAAAEARPNVARTYELTISDAVREAIAKRIAARRTDSEFQKRVRERMEEDRKVMERLPGRRSLRQELAAGKTTASDRRRGIDARTSRALSRGGCAGWRPPPRDCQFAFVMPLGKVELEFNAVIAHPLFPGWYGSGPKR
jgi:hypothetical protein